MGHPVYIVKEASYTHKNMLSLAVCGSGLEMCVELIILMNHVFMHSGMEGYIFIAVGL